MSGNNDRFENNMSELDGFLGGYDSSSGSGRSYNYGSTYNRGTRTDNTGYYNEYSNNSNHAGSENDPVQPQDSVNNFGQKTYNDNYVPGLNNYGDSSYGSISNVSDSKAAYPEYNKPSQTGQNSYNNNTNSYSSYSGRASSEESDNDLEKKTGAIASMLMLGTVLFLILSMIPIFKLFFPTINAINHYCYLKNNGDTVTAYVSETPSRPQKEQTQKATSYTSFVYFEYKDSNYTGKLNDKRAVGSEVEIYVNPEEPTDFVCVGVIYEYLPALGVFLFLVAIVLYFVIRVTVGAFSDKKAKKMRRRV